MKTIILKLGGSIITEKDNPSLTIRKTLISQIANQIGELHNKKQFNIIIVHGAGSFGHQLAHKYRLQKGTRSDKNKIQDALKTKASVQKLATTIEKIFHEKRIPVFGIRTSSIAINSDNQLKSLKTDTIQQAIEKNLIPVLHGDVTLDTTRTMSICSGDDIIGALAHKLNIARIYLATDVEGIFTKDPYTSKQAKLIPQITYKKLQDQNILGSSHNIDVSGGMLGKVASVFQHSNQSKTPKVIVFNGLNPKNFKILTSEKTIQHTIIT